jgi:[ribosomal protein S5]-alanine N-acetyltransferase
MYPTSSSEQILIGTHPVFFINTINLYIRQTFKKDLIFFVSLYRDRDVMEKYAEGTIRDSDRITNMIDINTKRWQDGNPYSSMSIFKIDTKQFIGNIFVSTFNRSDNTALLGYLIHREHWNKGYAKEAVLAVINHFIPHILKIKTVNKIIKIVAYSRIDNIYSQKILEAAGFQIDDIIYKYGWKRFQYGLTIENLKNRTNK